MNSCSNTGKILGALILGAAIGGSLGILFAPEKGSKTRKKILGKGEDATDAIKEKINDFLDGVKKEVASVTDRAKDLMESANAKADKLK